MKLENKVEDQMAFPLCFLRNPLSWIAALAPLLIFTAFLGFGFLSILFTSAVLILSSFLFTFSKQNQGLVVEKSVTEEVLRSEKDSSPYIEDVVSKLQPQSEAVTQKKDVQEEEVLGQNHDHNVRSPDSLSESECLDHLTTSEDSEVDWLFRDDVDQSPDCSDGSISDEESLIEIALPSGHYVGHKKEEPKLNLQQKLPDFTPQSIFKQHNLMELLAEINDMNEEDNLIEIDISMGSIKCSRFEIEA